MTRKRYVKLLMSQGYSRNVANACARKVAKKGITYQQDYNEHLEMARDLLGPSTFAGASADMQRAFRELNEAAGRALERMAVVVDALTVGMRAFSDAFYGRLNRE